MSGTNSSSFDIDGDSLMQSGNSSPKPSTPSAQIRSVQLSDLSPPNSQGVPLPSTSTTATTAITADTMPTAAPSVSGANMNGKRPISSIEQSQELLGAAASVMPTDAQSAAVAYQWTNPEDAPGYAWRNKKAQDEYNRAYESLVDKNRKIGNKYGDPYAMADRELAMINSHKQS